MKTIIMLAIVGTITIVNAETYQRDYHCDGKGEFFNSSLQLRLQSSDESQKLPQMTKAVWKIKSNDKTLFYAWGAHSNFMTSTYDSTSILKVTFTFHGRTGKKGLILSFDNQNFESFQGLEEEIEFTGWLQPNHLDNPSDWQIKTTFKCTSL